MILGTPKADWLAEFPRLADLIALRPSEWFNPAIAPSAEALADVGLGAADVADASARLQRFAPLIARLFPETAGSGGIIESGLVEVADFHDAPAPALRRRTARPTLAETRQPPADLRLDQGPRRHL
ncbi:D-serine dehydratase [Pseudomonas aeruginosa]|nr:D-serine dehydratase [Pseudomonas aeruginosa]